MPLIKPPHADPSLDLFDDGVGVLSTGGGDAGLVFTTRGCFWSPFSLRQQWCIWYVVVWNDGTRERAVEDYPPFIAVDEMKRGRLAVDSERSARSGEYDLKWLNATDARAAREKCSITPDSF